MDDPLGYVISVIMIGFSILALWMARRAVMKGATTPRCKAWRRRCAKAAPVVGLGIGAGLRLDRPGAGFVTLAPHVGILLMSFAKVWSFGVLPDAYTLEHYATVFSDASG